MDNSSSSSEEEDETVKQALREATDQDLFKNSFFSGNKSDDKENTVNDVNNKSEGEKRETQGFHNFGISIHFQEFVGKKLREYFDREIELVEGTPKNCKKEKNIGGIKLFNESTNVINCDQQIPLATPRRKRRKLRDRSENNISKLEKCKQAAVDPEFILSKCQVLSWDERQKGTVFIYKKMPDGTLVQYD